MLTVEETLAMYRADADMVAKLTFCAAHSDPEVMTLVAQIGQARADRNSADVLAYATQLGDRLNQHMLDHATHSVNLQRVNLLLSTPDDTAH